MNKETPGWRSAEALMADLEQDAAYRERRAALEADHATRASQTRSLLEPVLADLREAGLRLTMWDDLIQYAPLPYKAIRILTDWLPRIRDEWVQEILVRALAATKHEFDGTPLTAVFEGTSNPHLRWAVANTLSVANPAGVSGWVLRAAADRASGTSCEMLAIAAARLAPANEANPVLVSLLDEHPGHAAKALRISGRRDDVAALSAARTHAKGWVRSEIDSAIKAILKRT